MLRAMRVAALVVGAGRGERLAREEPKAFVPLAGRPLIAHAIETLASVAAIERVVPVVPADWCGALAVRLGPLARHSKLGAPVPGGATRQDSVRAGMAALGDDFALVAVHDAARPLLRAQDAARVVAAAAKTGAAILAVPVRDTIKRARAGAVLETPPRGELFAAQTPQVFRREWLREALAKASAEGRVGTDCAELVEALGVRVELVEGDPGNWKVTDAGDLERARQVLEGRARAQEART
jgi:2-C-methyl-D-erythritol 4-phosphate cytidylyltransferase